MHDSPDVSEYLGGQRVHIRVGDDLREVRLQFVRGSGTRPEGRDDFEKAPLLLRPANVNTVQRTRGCTNRRPQSGDNPEAQKERHDVVCKYAAASAEVD